MIMTALKLVALELRQTQHGKQWMMRRMHMQSLRAVVQQSQWLLSKLKHSIRHSLLNCIWSSGRQSD